MVDTAGMIIGALGISMIGMVMMMIMIADLNFQQSGLAPGNSPQPGSAGGGGSPNDASISTLAASLALVPAGATAVAVFPPFAK